MTTRRRWPLAIASLSVARVPSATAFEQGAVSSADGVAEAGPSPQPPGRSVAGTPQRDAHDAITSRSGDGLGR